MGKLRIMVKFNGGWSLLFEDSENPGDKVSWKEFAHYLDNQAKTSIGLLITKAKYNRSLIGVPNFQLTEWEKERVLKILEVPKDDFAIFKSWLTILLV